MYAVCNSQGKDNKITKIWIEALVWNSQCTTLIWAGLDEQN